MDRNIKELNKTLINGWMIIVLILIPAYFIEYLKGTRSFQYLIAFSCVTVIPAVLCNMYYKKHDESTRFRDYVLTGYFLMYTFVLFTGNTILVFTYVIPMLSLIVLYHQPKLVLVMGAVSIADNLVYDATLLFKGELTLKNSNQYEIKYAILITCFSFLYLASKLYSRICSENDQYVKQLDENHRQLQHVTLQTITTIANIIDAKDEYTKGHSYRVAEYSSVLAKALGYTDEQVQDIKYIGLLHDIGKIGVPDSILNKPGRLNDAEFSIMKSHVEIGGKILNGNRMIAGVDEGASYHHERWDGKGYPKGLSGTDIPEIARIIGIADAFDAMTSNRVYRKRLTDEEVLAELRRCSGSQFDPDICAVFVKLIEEGTLTLLSPDVNYEERRGSSLIEQSSELLKNILDYGKRSDDISHDYLTSTYSLQTGEKIISEMLSSGDGGLFIADITNIRKTNEKFGLLAGDHIIKTAAGILINRENIITVRFSGDQFLCFVPGETDITAFEMLLKSICQDITEAVENLAENMSNSAAIGGVLSNDAGRDINALVTAADKALFHVKNTHSPGVFVYSRNRRNDSLKNLSKRDLEQLIRSIEEEAYTGIYNVDYTEFTHIYNFIKNICKRNDQQMQLILMTMTPSAGNSPSVSERDEAMNLLETVINRTLRKVDVMFRFSSSQCIILLNNTSTENVELISQRIISSFYRLYDKKNMALSYDTADINSNSSENSKNAE